MVSYILRAFGWGIEEKKKFEQKGDLDSRRLPRITKLALPH
jgi:hypothetical protein